MWIRFRLVVLLALLSIFIGGNTRALDSGQGWPKVVKKAVTRERIVALSFDDAPSGDVGALLDILDNLDIRATFFIEGIYADRRPRLLKQIAGCGHELGNHTYGHPNMAKVSEPDIKSELERANNSIENVTGFRPHLFRPPAGRYTDFVVDTAWNMQMTTVLWSVTCDDYLDVPSDEIVSTVLSTTHPGSIILLHDGVSSTRDAVPEIVETLRARGYTIVTVGELLNETNGPCQWVASD